MKFTTDHLRKVLVHLDALLQTPTELMLVDLPHFQIVSYPPSNDGSGANPAADPDALRRAFDNAVARSGVNLPFIQAQVFDFPFLFESRLNPYPMPGLRNVTLQQANRHDVVAWHLLKQNKRAIADIQSMGQASQLSFEPLLESFCAVDSNHPNIRAARVQFLALVGERFGKTCEVQAESTLSERFA